MLGPERAKYVHRTTLVDFIDQLLPLENVDGGVLTADYQFILIVLVDVTEGDGKDVVAGHVPVLFLAVLVEALYGAVGTYEGQAVLEGAEVTAFNARDSVFDFLEEQVSVVERV